MPRPRGIVTLPRGGGDKLQPRLLTFKVTFPEFLPLPSPSFPITLCNDKGSRSFFTKNVKLLYIFDREMEEGNDITRQNPSIWLYLLETSIEQYQVHNLGNRPFSKYRKWSCLQSFLDKQTTARHVEGE